MNSYWSRQIYSVHRCDLHGEFADIHLSARKLGWLCQRLPSDHKMFPVQIPRSRRHVEYIRRTLLSEYSLGAREDEMLSTTWEPCRAVRASTRSRAPLKRGRTIYEHPATARRPCLLISMQWHLFTTTSGLGEPYHVAVVCGIEHVQRA